MPEQEYNAHIYNASVPQIGARLSLNPRTTASTTLDASLFPTIQFVKVDNGYTLVAIAWDHTNKTKTEKILNPGAVNPPYDEAYVTFAVENGARFSLETSNDDNHWEILMRKEAQPEPIKIDFTSQKFSKSISWDKIPETNKGTLFSLHLKKNGEYVLNSAVYLNSKAGVITLTIRDEDTQNEFKKYFDYPADGIKSTHSNFIFNLMAQSE